MALGNGLALQRQRRGWQMAVQRPILHGGAHAATRQVAAAHRYACGHCGHDHRLVAFPGPEFLVPVQGGAHPVLVRVRWQAVGGRARLGHLDHQRRQEAARGQPAHRVLLPALVLGRIMLLAQQQRLGALPVGQSGVPGLLGLGRTGAGPGATRQCQQHQGQPCQGAGAGPWGG